MIGGNGSKRAQKGNQTRRELPSCRFLNLDAAMCNHTRL
jgi:hypothetical protein